MRILIALLMILPLAACFDADVSMNFVDSETAEMNAVMTMGPELYAMGSQSGEDMCEDGEGVLADDGSYVCTISQVDTIDALIAQSQTETEGKSAPTDVSQGFTVERLDDDTVRVSFDLATMMKDASEGKPEDLGEMEAMLRAAFEGHAITLNVSGAAIVESNGEISEDGATATFVLPMLALLEDTVDLPEEFFTVVKTN